MGQFICGIFEDRAQAQKVVRALLEGGISSRQISMAVRERRNEEITHRDEEEMVPTAFSGISLSAAWDRVGWQHRSFPPYRTKIAPDVDMVILAAGPIALSLGGPQVNAVGGGLVGSVANFGFPLEVARKYEERVHAGAALVMVGGEAAEMDPVRRIFERFKAEDVATARRLLD